MLNINQTIDWGRIPIVPPSKDHADLYRIYNPETGETYMNIKGKSLALSHCHRLKRIHGSAVYELIIPQEETEDVSCTSGNSNRV